MAELSAQELQQIDLESGSVKAERERLAQQVAELQRSLKVQGARKSKAQLLAERSKLEAEVAAAEAELQRRKGPARAALSTQEAEKVKKLYVMLHKEFRERKRKCVDVVDMLCEQTGDRAAAASTLAAPPGRAAAHRPGLARWCRLRGCGRLVQKGAPASGSAAAGHLRGCRHSRARCCTRPRRPQEDDGGPGPRAGRGQRRRLQEDAAHLLSGSVRPKTARPGGLPSGSFGAGRIRGRRRP